MRKSSIFHTFILVRIFRNFFIPRPYGRGIKSGLIKNRKQFPAENRRKKFVVSVEINPAPNGDLQKNFREAALTAPFVDVLNVTDSPMARTRSASFVVAARLQRHFQIDTIFNFTCRDRNLIGLKSDLLGALILGTQNILCVTGDPATAGAKNIFEFPSNGLLQLLPKIESPTGEFFGGAVLNFFENLTAVEKIVARKKAAGARFLISQPVFTAGRIKLLQRWQTEFGVPILAGILPIKSFRAAKFMNEKIPGITVPADDLRKMEKMTDDKIFEFQWRKAAEIFHAARAANLAGAHFMPMGRGDKIAEIVGNFDDKISSNF